MSKELNIVYEQVAQGCASLDLEGRAIVLGVSGLDAVTNASFTKGLKAYLGAAGHEMTVIHLDEFVDTAVRQEILTSATPEAIQRFGEEGIDYAAAREAIQDRTSEKGILIAEGVFLYTGALFDLFDFRVYLDVDASVARDHLEAAKVAPGESRPEALFDAVLQPAFECYVREYDPASASDLCINMNDARKPRIITNVG